MGVEAQSIYTSINMVLIRSFLNSTQLVKAVGSSFNNTALLNHVAPSAVLVKRYQSAPQTGEQNEVLPCRRKVILLSKRPTIWLNMPLLDWMIFSTGEERAHCGLLLLDWLVVLLK